MRWRIAALSLALAFVAGGGAAYVATHRSSSTGQPQPAPTQLQPRPLPLAALDPTAPVPERRRLAHRIAKAVVDPAFGGALAGVIADADSGRVLYARGATTSVPPASTAKLLTAVAALETLGPDARLSTGVVRNGRTLVLLGGGDVTLARRSARGYPRPATLADLARRTAAAVGATRVYSLRYDATAWTGPTAAPGWNPGYFTTGNVSRLSALEVGEGRQGRSPYLPRAADPAQQAATAFVTALRQAGVHVRGRARPGIAKAGDLGVAEVASPTVATLVQEMLTDSDNDLAEAMGRAVALRAGRRPTFAGAATAVVSAVRRLGVPTAGVRLHDASGLSRLDRVTPSALIALLRVAVHRHPELQPVIAGLPIAAATGTLADRYRHRPAVTAAGVLRAKTGTLAGVNALAGTLVDADGDLLLFAFMTDRATDPSTTEHALDRLAARLAGCGCGGVTS